MPRAEEFDAFYAQTRSRLLHQTYALTGDLGAAAAALRDAFAHAWQHWRRLRVRDAEGWVRNEAGRLAALRHTAGMRRRLDESGADTQLLAELQALPASGRRLVLLQTLGELDLATAAREVAMTDQAAVAASDDALAALGSPGGQVGSLETRLDSLRTVTDRVAMPRATAIRKQGRRRQRRMTLLAVLISAALVAGTGWLVAAPDAGNSDAASADRRRVGEVRPTPPPPPPPPPPPGAEQAQLLEAPQVASLDPAASWRQVPTGKRTQYSICQAEPRADPQARAAYVRAFRADTTVRQRVVQAVEVSRGNRAAERAYNQMLRWHAACPMPGVQLVDHHRVARPGSDVEILRYRQSGNPVRTVTVAMSRTGVVTTALSHEVDRPRFPPLGAIGQSMADALTLLCNTSAGGCGTQREPQPAPLPATGEGRGFLGVVDLPAVPGRASGWEGTEPTGAAVNPAATLCDQADFTLPGFVRSRSRTFVMPESTLPDRFGLSQTLGTMRGVSLAQSFVDRLVAEVDGCADRELSVGVNASDAIGGDGVQAHLWQLSFELEDGETVPYRLGIVRVGPTVAELAFSGTQTADIGTTAFADLLLRAAERLTELIPERPAATSNASQA